MHGLVPDSIHRNGNRMMTLENHPSDLAAHWECVYRTKEEADISWHQDEPALSMELIERLAPRGARVIDVGGGSSVLAGRLASRGFHATVLDLSPAALDRAKARIGCISDRVQWIIGDVTTIENIAQVDLWHDRAAFHFLTKPDEQDAYAALAARSVMPEGHVVIATFALQGPSRRTRRPCRWGHCSGLAVQRHDEASLSKVFGESFVVVRTIDETHITPWGKPQAFFIAVMRRVGSR